ncbi:MAG: DUF5661 family protein [Actinomycetota bacterium]
MTDTRSQFITDGVAIHEHESGVPRHGLSELQATVVTDDDPLISGKIAWAHLKEFSDYYDRLTTMEQEAEASSFDR